MTKNKLEKTIEIIENELNLKRKEIENHRKTIHEISVKEYPLFLSKELLLTTEEQQLYELKFKLYMENKK